NCILQDKRGFIWIGTDDGLNRYDGERFVIFRNDPRDPGTISGNIISGLLEDGDGIIWITTIDGGLSRYDYRLPPAKQFKQYRHQPGDPNTIPTNIINAIVADRLGYLWLASSGHSVLRFDKKNERFLAPVPDGTRTILSLCLAGNGMIWAGRQGGGLLKINPADLTYEQDPRYRDLYAPLPHAAVTALLMDSGQDLWLGSWDGVLYRYRQGKTKEEVFQQTSSPYSFANDQIMSFAEDSLGRIWMGGAAKGLHVLDKKAGYFYNYRSDLSREGTIADNRINCIYIDGEGNLWVGTNKGVSINNPVKQQFSQTFLTGEGPGDPATVYCFLEAENNDLWIGTSHGLYIRERKSGTMIHRPLRFRGKKLHITCIFKDKCGAMYLGTDYSLFRYEPAS
ncbi:MAG TPA: two-component regulator propeller domain-containing protein, partial [Anseongella sp.]|nr:two-component regulator propeller domain-containing protein [Anseongella sp.]